MSDEQIDLSTMEWKLETGREEELAERILAASGPTLARRSATARSTFDLTRWLRPVLAAAAVLAALSIATIQRIERDGSSSYGVTEDALNLPSPVGEWIARDDAPGMGELLALTSESEE
ncbi:MAG: hypothetical protein ABR527_06040 [Gemmatimonadota bacterium]